MHFRDSIKLLSSTLRATDTTVLSVDRLSWRLLIGACLVYLSYQLRRSRDKKGVKVGELAVPVWVVCFFVRYKTLSSVGNTVCQTTSVLHFTTNFKDKVLKER